MIQMVKCIFYIQHIICNLIYGGFARASWKINSNLAPKSKYINYLILNGHHTLFQIFGFSEMFKFNIKLFLSGKEN